MSPDSPDLALDANGIPILTNLVSNDQLTGAATDDTHAAQLERKAEDIARDLLESDIVQLRLEKMASDLANSVHLQIQQSLATAIDELVKQTMDSNTVITHKHIRQQLDAALPALITRALKDSDLAT